MPTSPCCRKRVRSEVPPPNIDVCRPLRSGQAPLTQVLMRSSCVVTALCGMSHIKNGRVLEVISRLVYSPTSGQISKRKRHLLSDPVSQHRGQSWSHAYYEEHPRRPPREDCASPECKKTFVARYYDPTDSSLLAFINIAHIVKALLNQMCE